MEPEATARAALATATDPAAIRSTASTENFPVALRVLPAALRADLLAIYDTARLIDELGDEAPGDRLALLDAVEAELLDAFEGRARNPVLAALVPTLHRRSLPREPFLRLIEANRRDQHEPAMASWTELVESCHFSANPVGELVLHCLGAAQPRLIALSNDVCTALQVVEHCQDVAEDAAAGRVYLPRDELASWGCDAAGLQRSPAPMALRRVIATQVGRVRGLLRSGPPLAAMLSGWGRVIIAGFVAGGVATCDALARAGFDANSRPARPRRRDIASRALSVLVQSAQR